jgi:hypothetical protein
MALLAIAVLVAAVGVSGFGRHAVVTHQGLILRRVLLRVAVVMHRQRHAVGAVPFGRCTQFPQSILQSLTQAGEALREAQRRVFPVRMGQHKVVQQVRKRLPLNGDVQVVHVREVRGPQPARFMHLTEIHFLGRPVFGLPPPRPSFHRSPLLLPVLAGVFTLKHLDQRFRLQRWLPLQQLFQTRPHLHERIGTRTPGVRCTALAGQLATVAVFPASLTIHACFHRCLLQRRPPIKVLP